MTFWCFCPSLCPCHLPVLPWELDLLCCGTSRLVRFPQISLRDIMPSLLGGRGGRIDLHVQNQSTAVFIISSHYFLSLFFSTCFFLFLLCFGGGFWLFFSTLVALTTVKWILFSLRTIFLSYTISVFQIAQNNFTEWTWGKWANIVIWVFLFILGNRKEKWHVPLNVRMNYIYFIFSV